MTETQGHASRAVDVEIAGLSKAFRSGKTEVKVLQDLVLEVAAGEMLVLLGPSGCGKTTLLRSVVGLEQPDAGTIRLRGKTVVDVARGIVVPPNKRGVGMVFQNYALWPHMTVAENVAFPLKAQGQRAAIKDGRVSNVLEVVQCGHLADRYPSQLSGGQQQRIALARALAPRPAVMLLDEPLSNLDALLRVDLRSQLHLLHKQVGFTGMYVTHDQAEAMSLGTRVVVMRSGRMEQVGPPNEIYSRPANEYVAEFLGMRNALACTVTSDGQLTCAGSATALPANFIRPGRYRVRCRPGDLAVRSPDAGASTDHGTKVWLSGARIVDSMRYADAEELVVNLGGETVLAELRGRVGGPLGEVVEMGLDLRSARFFNESGILAETRLVG